MWGCHVPQWLGWITIVPVLMALRGHRTLPATSAQPVSWCTVHMPTDLVLSSYSDRVSNNVRAGWTCLPECHIYWAMCQQDPFEQFSGDDHQALIWDIQQMPRAIEDPILAYTAAEGEINQIQWGATQPDWIAICYNKALEILRVWTVSPVVLVVCQCVSAGCTLVMFLMLCTPARPLYRVAHKMSYHWLCT